MIGYAIAGPLLALFLSLGYTKNVSRKLWHKITDDSVNQLELISNQQTQIHALNAKVELLEKRNEAVDKETLQKIMTTVMPIAKAVNKLNQEVGL